MQASGSFINKFIENYRADDETKLTHLNPSWVRPTTSDNVTIFVRKKDSYVRMKGYFDINQETWVKANGVSVGVILGWTQ